MISLSRKSDYALVALVALARLGSEQRLSARALSERHALPGPALRNILKDLGRRGLLESEQGVRGGYRLALPADRIAVADVVEAIDGPARTPACCRGDGDDGPCPGHDACPIRGSIRDLEERLVGVLRTVTVQDLAAESLVGAGERGSGRRAATRQRLGDRTMTPARRHGAASIHGEDLG